MASQPSHHNHAAGNHHTLAQLRDISGDVHITTTSTSPGRLPVPRQLPSPPSHFTNREAELGWLARTQQHTLQRQRRELAVICGQGGVGKSALATHFLGCVADAFPDGQLYADLRGFSSSTPADPSSILDAFLRAVGVAAEAIPTEASARAALWRTHTHGKRLALLLDDAASAAQVRCLLPGEGAHLVVVTSRHRLAGLLAEGACFLPLEPLGEPAATGLLARLLEPTPHAAHPRLGELAHLCAGLPLALCVAAAPLLLHPHTSVPTTIGRLTEQRLRALSTPGKEGFSVTATFDASYAALSESAAQLYRRAGLHPGPDFDLAAAAALADLDAPTAEEAMGELLSAHLLQNPAPGRYRFHELARDHAHATVHAHDSESERQWAREQMLEHYMIHAAAADHTLNPWRFRLARALFDQAAHTDPFDQDRTAALAWMETELPTLAAMVRLAHDSGRHQHAWRLCETLKMTLALTKHYDTWRTCCQLGLASAQALKDPEAEAFMHMMLGSLHQQTDCDTDAATHHHEALRLWRSVGHRQGQASALECLGLAARHRGDWEEARIALTRSLDLHLELGSPRGAAIQTRHLADLHRAAGHHPQALAHYQHALDYFRDIGDDYMIVRALVGLAATHLHLGAIDHTQATAQEALELAETISAHHEVANAHLLLADVAHHHNDAAGEGTHLTRAHQIYTDLGSPNAETTHQRLANLDHQ